MKTTPPPLKVVKGEGVWLELEDGRRILDCISSWWVTIHGHGHPALAEALYHQAQQLEQVIFANFTHDPAEQLARKLLTHLPDVLTRVFWEHVTFAALTLNPSPTGATVYTQVQLDWVCD